MNNNASEEQNTNSRSEPHRTTRHKPPLYFTSLSERVKEMPKMRVSLGARGRGAITAPPAVAGARQEALYELKHLVTHSRSHLAHPTLSPSAPPLRTVAGGAHTYLAACRSLARPLSRRLQPTEARRCAALPLPPEEPAFAFAFASAASALMPSCLPARCDSHC